MHKSDFYEEIFNTVLGHSFDLFAYIDMEMRYQYVSRSYACFWGFEVEDLVGKTPKQVFHNETLSQVISPLLKKCIDEKRPVNNDAWVRGQNNEQPCYLYFSYLPHISKQTGQVMGIIVIARDMTEFKRAEGILAKSANTDALTDIPNRLFLEKKLKELTQNSSRQTDRFALLFCDLDGFKVVNDNHGHAVGDKVLYQVARRLTKNIRNQDILARYGGDEFVILINPLYEDSVINRIKDKVERSLSQPFDVSGKIIKVGVSIGCSTFPDETTNLSSLLNAADQRMYDCKNQKS